MYVARVGLSNARYTFSSASAKKMQLKIEGGRGFESQFLVYWKLRIYRNF